MTPHSEESKKNTTYRVLCVTYVTQIKMLPQDMSVSLNSKTEPNYKEKKTIELRIKCRLYRHTLIWV